MLWHALALPGVQIVTVAYSVLVAMPFCCRSAAGPPSTVTARVLLLPEPVEPEEAVEVELPVRGELLPPPPQAPSSASAAASTIPAMSRISGAPADRHRRVSMP